MKSNDKFKKYVKDCIFYHFDGIVKIEDFDLYNIFIDEKPYENNLDYNISYKNLIAGKPLRTRFDKQMETLEFIMELDIQYYLEVKNMILFITGLDIQQEQEVVLHMLFS